MSGLTPAVEAALSQPRALIFGALRIALPGGTLRLLDGAGKLTMSGESYVGRDPAMGTWGGLEQINDGVGDQAPAVSIILLPKDADAVATLMDPAAQGSEVQIWFGVVERATGVPIPDPDLLFLGEYDVPTLRAGRGTRSISVDCVSAFERLFADDEGIKLSDAFHTLVWPGETGLANVTGVTKKIYWGEEPAGGSVSIAKGGGFAGGVSRSL